MDTSEYPAPLPSLGQINLQLATNSRRVEATVDSQLDSIERLLSAAIAEDWPAVAAVSQHLSQLDPKQVGPELVREAREVYDELCSAGNPKRQPKHLTDLLAACRRVRQNRTSA